MASLETNFNVSPYYDDYSEDKNFHRILFRPAVPVQARELTQLQTILQNQVERFGDNIYKQGTIIKGCTFTYDYNYEFIKIKDLQVDGVGVIPSSYVNLYATETTSNLNAVVVNYSNGLESQDPDTNILYVKYLNTGTGQKKKFANNETITLFNQDYRLTSITINNGGSLYTNSDFLIFTSANGQGSGAAANVVTYSNGTIRTINFSSYGNGYVTVPTVTVNTSTGSAASLSAVNYVAQIAVCNSSFTANSSTSGANVATTPVGTGTAVTVSDGVIYQKGNFVRVEQQTVIVDKFSKTPNNVVLGFYTQESIVNSSVDSTLLDNAQGYSNYTAPGAHRLKLTPQLKVVSAANAAANTEFFKLVEFENGRVTKRKTDTEFNSINKKLSQRTAEESGDYVVNQFTIGTEDIAGNTTHINVTVGPGVAYVDGERVELIDTVKTAIRQGTDTEAATNQTIAANYGNYVLVNEAHGVFDFTSGATINLRNTAATDVTDNFGGAPTTPGSVIGTAKIRSMVYDSGVPGTSTCQYRLYVFDIVMSSGYKFKDIRSVQISGGVADLVLEEGVAVLKDTDFDSLVFPSGYTSVDSVTGPQFTYRTVTSNTISTGGTVTIQVTGLYDKFPYTASSTLNNIQEQDFIVVPTANAIGSTNLSGTVISLGNVVTGTGTDFVTQLDVGEFVKFQGNTDIFRITGITNATSMRVSGSGPGVALIANVYNIAFPANVPIKMDRGTANIQISALRDTATIYIGNTINSSAAVKVYHNVQVVPGSNIIHKAKTVTKNVYVKLSTAKLANTTGPWCLGIPDVLKLNAVYVGTGNTYSNTTTNYASSFELVNGQSDNLYGLSYLKYKPGSTLSVSNTNCLLVSVDLFTHGSGYYISTDSYPVDDSTEPLPNNKIRTENIPTFVSPKTNKVLSLRDVIDTRPIVANTANAAATTVAGATIDPSSTEVITGSTYFPTPNDIFQADLTYYLARADRILLDRNGNITVKEGVPSTTPVPAKVSDKSMLLATVLVPPYPSLSPKDARDAKRPDYSTLIKSDQVKRYTMKDIKQIEDRLKNLEYYSILSLLEKNAKDLVIPSEANTSVSRFKNGFFVDPFNSYDVANVNDPEFNVVIDTKASVARPSIGQEVVNLKFNASNSSNYAVTGDLASISYDHATAFEQPLATRYRNLAQLAWGYEGTVRLFPQYDNYYDVDTKAVGFTFDLSTPLNNLINTINDSVEFKADSKKVTVSTSDWQNVGPTWWDGALNQKQTGTQTTTTDLVIGSVGVGTSVQSEQKIGDFISDFDFNPFVREQEIYFMVTGLRPGARHYVYFDKTSVESRPGEVLDLSSITNSASLKDNDAFRFTDVKGANLVANSTGGLAGAIYIPGNTFNVGQKEVLILDIDDIDSLDTSISKSSAFFNAYNFNKEVSSLTMVTKAPSSFSSVVTNKQIVNTTPISRTRRWDPLSQTFSINFNDGTDGVWLTKFDLYFKQKSSTTGVTVQIRETDNGYPSPVILEQKQLASADVNVSDDGQTATTVVLDTPVFIRNNKDYCIALLPDANSPDWLVWSSVPGQPDVFDNRVDNGDFGIGVMFISSNDKVWTPIQNEDLKFTAYYAKFNSDSGSVVLNNDDYEFLTVSGQEGTFVGGERVAQKSNTYITGATLTSNTSSKIVNTSSSLTSSISADDYLLFIFGGSKTAAKTGTISSSGNTVTGTGTTFATELATGDYILVGNDVREVTAIANSTQISIDAPLTSSASGASFYGVTEYYQVNKVLSANSTTITCKDNLEQAIDNSTVYGSIQKVVSAEMVRNSGTNTITLNKSNAANSSFLFESGRKIVGSVSDATATVSTIDDYTVNYTELHVSSVIPNPCTLNMSLDIAGTSASTSTQDVSFGISNKTLYEAEVRSRSNEITGYSGAKSLKITANLGKPSGSNKVSPVVDLNPASVVVLQNKINNNSSNETTRYGSALVKYVSNRVVLADGLDAEDLKFYLTAYKPSGTSVLVYAKLMSNDDKDNFNDKDWTLLNQDTEANLYSDLANLDDYIEYEYSVPRTPPSSSVNGVVTTNSNTTLTGTNTTFTTDFSAGDLIKIVNSSTLTDYEINVVNAVGGDGSLTLVAASGPYSNTTTSGLTVEKVTQPKAAFKYSKDEAIVRYYDGSQSAHSTYKVYAIKVVLLSSSTQVVPTIKDIRAVAVSV